MFTTLASGDLRIAYATFGDGPVDFVFVPGFVSHLENWWEANASARFFRRIASFSRLIMFDKRGTGMSDQFDGRADARGADRRRAGGDGRRSDSTSAFVCGLSEGGPDERPVLGHLPRPNPRADPDRIQRADTRGAGLAVRLAARALQTSFSRR